ncbi:hypothetical protein [Leptolyngbya sp. PCC 6406]|uniref:hypothetical protein n=1 Tax=Leptolyngbya sp. PCC 6406 TaxID=1173264 RepID=UPI0002AC1E9C|nr:hypothetical protein [Leptolyngbya sp. PCC 6406]
MLIDSLPFQFSLDKVAIAGSALWALGLYLTFATLGQWVSNGLNRWFNFAERSLYMSEEEFERTRKGRESQNAFWASVLSIVPFLIVGFLLHYGIEGGLGTSWSISLSLIVLMGSGIYELGRRNSQDADS